MKLSRYHFMLLSVIGILLVVNYVIIKSHTDSKFSNSFAESVYAKGVALENQEAVESSLASDQVMATNTPIIINAIDTISQKDNTQTASILHFGDAMFDRNVRKRMSSGVDPFSNLRALNITNNYDIRMLNLEGPIIETDRKNCQQKAYNFQFASNTAQMLKEEGFNAVTLANNHIYDCYKSGAISTYKYLELEKIEAIGKTAPNDAYKIITIDNGMRVVLVGIDTTINPLPSASFYANLLKLKNENDVLLVSMHSGEEYLPKANLAQKNLAHKLVDSGADVVIGHHPHVVENMEVYNSGVIFYSLGNFIFDQVGDKENEGLGVGLDISKNNINMMLFPYNILNSVPTFKIESDAESWCNNYLTVNSNIKGVGCLAIIKR